MSYLRLFTHFYSLDLHPFVQPLHRAYSQHENVKKSKLLHVCYIYVIQMLGLQLSLKVTAGIPCLVTLYDSLIQYNGGVYYGLIYIRKQNDNNLSFVIVSSFLYVNSVTNQLIVFGCQHLIVQLRLFC